ILQIKSDGDWEITVTQAFTQEVTDVREFTGEGDFTIGPLTTTNNQVEFQGEYNGEGNFIAGIYDVFGSKVASLFNEIGSYEGNHITVVEPESVLFIDVTASGPWKITMDD